MMERHAEKLRKGMRRKQQLRQIEINRHAESLSTEEVSSAFSCVLYLQMTGQIIGLDLEQGKYLVKCRVNSSVTMCGESFHNLINVGSFFYSLIENQGQCGQIISPYILLFSSLSKCHELS